MSSDMCAEESLPKWKVWNEKYHAVLKVLEAHDGLQFPRNEEENQLMDWLRQQKRRKKMPVYQAKKLDFLKTKYGWGMTRKERNDKAWHEMVQRYIAFGKEHGHFVVRQADDKRLHKWILNQRQAYKNGLISEERRVILEDLDFVFACNKCRKNKEFTMKQDMHWTEMFIALEEFCKREGHCRVPYIYGELGRWVSKQRNLYAHGLLDQARKE